MLRLGLLAALTALFALPVFSSDDHDHGNACMQGATAQFGRYVGDWKITDESLAQDGSGWSPGNGARWTFKCVEGVAIQDYWYPNNGGFGTNLRTYNPSSDRWEIVWAAQGQQGLQHISARQDEDGKIIMSIDKPKPAQLRRIIFFAPDDDGWNWAMQWSMDEGKNWFDVYRIRATPWED